MVWERTVCTVGINWNPFTEKLMPCLRTVWAVSSHRLIPTLPIWNPSHPHHTGVTRVKRLVGCSLVINSVRGTQPLVVLMLLLSLYSQRVHQTAKKISPKLPHTALGLWLHQQQDCNLTTTTAIGHCPRNLKSYIMALLKIPYSKAKSLSEVSNACSVSGM